MLVMAIPTFSLSSFSKPPFPLLPFRRTLLKGTKNRDSLANSVLSLEEDQFEIPSWRNRRRCPKDSNLGGENGAFLLENKDFDETSQTKDLSSTSGYEYDAFLSDPLFSYSNRNFNGFANSQFKMTLAELLEKSTIVPASTKGDIGVPITGIQNDSRKVICGDLFVCCHGFKTNGHLYVSEAIQRGATAIIATEDANLDDRIETNALILVEDTNAVLPLLAATFYGNPSKKLLVIGITGTNGKTTTTHLVRSIFEAMKVKTGMLGSIGYYIHGNCEIEAANTTPDAVAVQKMMAEIVQLGTKAVAMEVSSIGLAVGRCDEIDFDVAVFMNLTRDHHDFHKNDEEYRNSKLKLFKRMVDPIRHRKIVNIDDPSASFFIAAGNSDVPIVTFGMANVEADVYPLRFEFSIFGTKISVRTPKGVLEISSGLIGRFNMYNTLAAVAVGIAVAVPTEEIVRGIEEVNGISGRFELINESQNFAVVVDYAHSPDSFTRILDAARELGARRIITVFGCAGETDKGKRPMLTKIAAEKSNVVILTTGNPKSENQLDIFDDMLAGVGWTLKDYLQYVENGHYPILPNGHRLFLHDIRRVAIRAAIAMGKEGDTVFVLARGHESYQMIGNRKIYIDDREECREALRYVDELHRAGMDKRTPRMVLRELPMPFSTVAEAWHTTAGQTSACAT